MNDGTGIFMILGLLLTFATTGCCFALGATLSDNPSDRGEAENALRNLLDSVYSIIREMLKIFEERRRDAKDDASDGSGGKPELGGRGRSPISDDVVFADGLNVGSSLFSSEDGSWDNLDDDDSEKDGLNTANYLGAFFKKRNYGYRDDELDQKDGADKSSSSDRKWAKPERSESNDKQDEGDEGDDFDSDASYDSFDEFDEFDAMERVLDDPSLSYAQKVKRLREEFENGRRQARVPLVYALLNYVDELEAADEKIATEALDEARDLLSPDGRFNEDGEYFDPDDPEYQKLRVFILLQRSIFCLKNDLKPNIETVNEALSLAEKLYASNPVDDSQLVLARVYLVQGNVYLANELEEVALNSFQSAYDTVDLDDVGEESEDEEKVILRGVALRARAEAYRRIGDYPQELKTFREVVGYWKDCGDRDVCLSEFATASFHLAATLQRTSPQESLERLDDAIAAQERLYSYDESKYAVELVLYLNVRADCLLQRGEQVEALAALERAISIAAQYLELETNTRKRESMFRLAADSYLRRGTARHLLKRSVATIAEDCRAALQMHCNGMKYDPAYSPHHQIFIILFFLAKIIGDDKRNNADIGEIVKYAERLYEQLSDAEKSRVRFRMSIVYLEAHNFFALNGERDDAMEMTNRALALVDSRDSDDLSVEDREALIQALRQRAAFNTTMRRALKDAYRDSVEAIRLFESLRREDRLGDGMINAFVDSHELAAICCVAERKLDEARAFVAKAIRITLSQIHNSEWDCQALGLAFQCALCFCRYDGDKFSALRLIRLVLKIVKKLQIQILEFNADSFGEDKEEFLTIAQKEKFNVLERVAVDFRLARIELLSEEETIDETFLKILGESEPGSDGESEITSANRSLIPYYQTLRRDVLFCVYSAARRAGEGLDDAEEILNFSMRYFVRRLAWDVADYAFAFDEIRKTLETLLARLPERSANVLRNLLVEEESEIPNQDYASFAINGLEPAPDASESAGKKNAVFNSATSCVRCLSETLTEMRANLLGKRTAPSYCYKIPKSESFEVAFLHDELIGGDSSRKAGDYLKKLDARSSKVTFNITKAQKERYSNQAEKSVFASLYARAAVLAFDFDSITLYSQEFARMLPAYRAIKTADVGRTLHLFSKRAFDVRYRNHELYRNVADILYCFQLGEFFFLQSKSVFIAKAAYIKASELYEKYFERLKSLDNEIDRIAVMIAVRLASIYRAEKNRVPQMTELIKALRANLRVCEKQGVLDPNFFDQLCYEIGRALKERQTDDLQAIPRRAFQFLLYVDKMGATWAKNFNAVLQNMTAPLANYYINHRECFAVSRVVVERLSFSTPERIDLLNTSALFSSVEVSEKFAEAFQIERDFWALYGSIEQSLASVERSLEAIGKILSRLGAACTRVIRTALSEFDSEENDKPDDENASDDSKADIDKGLDAFEKNEERIRVLADGFSELFDMDGEEKLEEGDEKDESDESAETEKADDSVDEAHFKAYSFWLKKRDLLRSRKLYLLWKKSAVGGTPTDASFDNLLKTPEDHRLRFDKLWRDDPETDELRAYVNDCCASEVRRFDPVKEWFKRFRNSKPAPKFTPTEETLADLEVELLAYFVEDAILASPDVAPKETLQRNREKFLALTKRVDFSPEFRAQVFYAWSLFARRNGLINLGMKLARKALQVLPQIEKSSFLVVNASSSEIAANKRGLLLSLEIQEHLCRMCLERKGRGDLASAEKTIERGLDVARKMFNQKFFCARPYYAKLLVVAAKLRSIRKQSREAEELAKRAARLIQKCEARALGYWPSEVKADVRVTDAKVKELDAGESGDNDSGASRRGD